MKKLIKNDDIVVEESAAPTIATEIETSIENNDIGESSQTSDTQELSGSQEEKIIESQPQVQSPAPRRSTRERKVPKRYEDYELDGVVVGV